jgi:hypothetical protein
LFYWPKMAIFDIGVITYLNNIINYYFCIPYKKMSKKYSIF